jgi:hypothetical protein
LYNHQAVLTSPRIHQAFGGSVLVLSLALIACGGDGDGNGSNGNTINGTLSLNTDSLIVVPAAGLSPGAECQAGGRVQCESGYKCAGSGGYDDIGQGAQVVVKDGSGNTIATGELHEGRSQRSYASSCSFDFAVTNVSAVDFYSIEVSHRGAITFSREELEAKGWNVGVTLGD